ncbi:MAG: hypothetical protein EBT00_11300 [Proteobacteria bacterium]|nr:hypothetical protein [Pseudomonadota bacterium]
MNGPGSGTPPGVWGARASASHVGDADPRAIPARSILIGDALDSLGHVTFHVAHPRRPLATVGDHHVHVGLASSARHGIGFLGVSAAGEDGACPSGAVEGLDQRAHGGVQEVVVGQRCGDAGARCAGGKPRHEPAPDRCRPGALRSHAGLSRVGGCLVDHGAGKMRGP